MKTTTLIYTNARVYETAAVYEDVVAALTADTAIQIVTTGDERATIATASVNEVTEHRRRTPGFAAAQERYAMEEVAAAFREMAYIDAAHHYPLEA